MPNLGASSERERRLQILTSWWREQIPGAIKGYLATHEYEIKNARLYLGREERWDVHGFEVSSSDGWTWRLVTEAQKRWAVSRGTARDYAEVVRQATWDEMIKDFKKMASTNEAISGQSLPFAYTSLTW